ncbi:hypothetical protein DICPUDRAFT_87071 [Dictyostelium purpureum]|uniref:RRM domain-containing protein n=1 Tax=Dictyostelium purpureum TaxID=5786 RepID=F0ZFS0_DICPU|nr:uncharacterized protein DICPUDRAFT_87071 [Dictyostelium purpureum]EGC37204.1 hypothetical protein DICPUDRAFT_87071 [Dictyostelium purpureum]|eukprot:XP_003286255.1 hypothetical protein DICPUDRAFT_87071 [Dictyostelium purpureum]
MEVEERMMANGDNDNQRRGSPSPRRQNGDMNRDSHSPHRGGSPNRGNSRSPHRGGSPNRGHSPIRGDDKRRGDYNTPRNRLANTASPSCVLGVFGLSPSTEERDIKDEFTKFGKIDHVDLIMDRKTGRSKCFGFVYFENKDDAVRAKEECQDLILHGKHIRTDFSATKRPHDPTPGRYYGNPKYDSRRSPPPRFSPYGERGERYGREDRYGREERGDRYGREERGDRYGREERGDRYGREDRHRDDSRDRYDRFREERPRDGYRR